MRRKGVEICRKIRVVGVGNWWSYDVTRLDDFGDVLSISDVYSADPGVLGCARICCPNLAGSTEKGAPKFIIVVVADLGVPFEIEIAHLNNYY